MRACGRRRAESRGGQRRARFLLRNSASSASFDGRYMMLTGRVAAIALAPISRVVKCADSRIAPAFAGERRFEVLQSLDVREVPGGSARRTPTTRARSPRPQSRGFRNAVRGGARALARRAPAGTARGLRRTMRVDPSERAGRWSTPDRSPCVRYGNGASTRSSARASHVAVPRREERERRCGHARHNATHDRCTHHPRRMSAEFTPGIPVPGRAAAHRAERFALHRSGHEHVSPRRSACRAHRSGPAAPAHLEAIGRSAPQLHTIFVHAHPPRTSPAARVLAERTVHAR